MSATIRPEFDRPAFSLLPYLRLMRLPNVFTALSNVAMGFLFVHHPESLHEHLPAFALLLVSSACLYTAGMVLNDVFDFAIDKQERPFRPLPSGQVSLVFAQRMGIGLLVAGGLLGSWAGRIETSNEAPRWLSGVIAILLLIAILAYNGGLKKTPLGPLGMGACRMLNVLLGMSTPAIAFDAAHVLGFTHAQWLVAGGMGLYVVGITCFARGEAGVSRLGPLMLGLVLMTGGIAMLASLPLVFDVVTTLIRNKPHLAYLLFGLLGFSIARRAIVALTDPSPQNVQGTVKHALLSIIVFDAAVTVLVAGPPYGLAVAALVLPAMFLGRWVYAT